MRSLLFSNNIKGYQLFLNLNGSLITNEQIDDIYFELGNANDGLSLNSRLTFKDLKGIFSSKSPLNISLIILILFSFVVPIEYDESIMFTFVSVAFYILNITVKIFEQKDTNNYNFYSFKAKKEMLEVLVDEIVDKKSFDKEYLAKKQSQYNKIKIILSK